LEWNGFSLPMNGSERNSEVFLFHETDGIPTELPFVPSCFVFRGIFFCRKMATLVSGGTPRDEICVDIKLIYGETRKGAYVEDNTWLAQPEASLPV
jgi:hypothetical protein